MFVRIMAHTPYRLNKIGNLIDGGYRIVAICHARIDGRYCENTAALDLNYLASRYGRDFDLLHKHIAPFLRCSQCGTRGRAERGGLISLQILLPKHLAYGTSDNLDPPSGSE